MTKKLTPEEERLIERVIVELKKLVKKLGYEYVIIGCNRYIKNTKEKKKLIQEIKKREEELAKLRKNL